MALVGLLYKSAMAANLKRSQAEEESGRGFSASAISKKAARKGKKIDGMEDGYNGNVRSRAIVIHPWSAAREEVVDDYGYLGLSWGCPAIDDRIAEEVIDTISDGTMVFTWYDDGDWSRNSAYLP